MVVDDYAWAARYAHTINAQQAAYRASLQTKGSSYVQQAGAPQPYQPVGVYR